MAKAVVSARLAPLLGLALGEAALEHLLAAVPLRPRPVPKASQASGA